jgi:hypothetical protein
MIASGRLVERPSDQDEIDEREERTADGQGYHGIIGTDIGMLCRQ